MSYCAPACNVPCGVGYGSVGSSRMVLAAGGGSLSGLGGGIAGVGAGWGYGPVACSSAVPGSNVVIEPPAIVVTLPGPILSTLGDMGVVGYSACSDYGSPYRGGGAYGGSSWGRGGQLGLGGGYCGGYGGGRWRRHSAGRRRPYSGSCGPC